SPARGRDRAVHHARLPLPCGRRDADELPPAALDAVHAGGGVLRARRDEARLRACGRGGLPVLFLRRRLPAVPLVWDYFSSNRLPADAFAGALREEAACKSFMSFVPF